LAAYAKQVSQIIGHNFMERTICLTALTGAAATEIGGRTMASVYGYMRRTFYSTFNDIKYFKDTRLNIIDKISFALYHNVLGKISQNLKAFTECHNFTFRKHDICFLGDFCQLKAFGNDLIYKHQNGIYWEGSLNCMVELKGTHQFNQCKDMQRIMPDMQDGVLSPEDRNILNSRVINGKDVMKPNPLETKYATFHNKNKAKKLNASVF
jgi:hypothetical protein